MDYVTNITSIGNRQYADIERTADVLAGIDASIDEALAERERLMVRDDPISVISSSRCNNFSNGRLADANELIDIVDELRVIEHNSVW